MVVVRVFVDSVLVTVIEVVIRVVMLIVEKERVL